MINRKNSYFEMMTGENKNWLTQKTGDPFADTGGHVIKFLWTQPFLKQMTILELIEYIAKIYVNKWGSKLNAFFLNSTITQPAFKGDRKIDETLKYYKSLIEETASKTEGYCRISGRKTKLFSAGRDNHILSGSGTFINFHHSFDSGLLLSKEILIRMFFVPFGLLQLSDKISLVYSNNEQISESFVYQNCKSNLAELASGVSEGILKSPFSIPTNALFQFVDDYVRELKFIDKPEEDNAPSLTLYHFTNFGASPEVIIHKLPSEIFLFYIFCNRIQFQSDWSKFIRAHYRNSKFKGSIFNEDTEVWQGKEDVEYGTYRTWRNDIFEKLLHNDSILPNIVRWAINHDFSFKIVEIYQTLIRNMEKRTLEKIKQVADFIVSNKDADYIKKCITRLNRERSTNGLRLFMLKLNEQNYNQDGKEPLINLEDFVEYLFPDGINWREIRDVLLIAIYERLHALKMKIETESIEEDIESITEN